MEVIAYLVKEAKSENSLLELIRDVLNRTEKSEDTVSNMMYRDKNYFGVILDFIID